MQIEMKQGVDNQMYQVCNGTWYNKTTAIEVIRVLEEARMSNKKIRVRYGATNPNANDEFGRDWLEEWAVEGRISRSMGPIKIPLLIKGKEPGGPGILDHCIVRILDSKKNVLYSHPSYHIGEIKIGPAEAEGYVEAVYVDNKLHAQFKKTGQASKWVSLMTA